MTPGQLIFHSKIFDEDDDADFYTEAMAVRLGHHGSEKTWKDIERNRL